MWHLIMTVSNCVTHEYVYVFQLFGLVCTNYIYFSLPYNIVETAFGLGLNAVGIILTYII